MMDDSAFYSNPKALEAPEDIINSLSWQINDSENKVIVLVEGNIDCVLYGAMLYSDVDEICIIYPVESNVENTKGKILRIMSEASIRVGASQFKFIGIVDSDFNTIEGKKRAIDGLFYTDTHDAETMLMSTGALGRMFKDLVEDGTIDKEAQQRVLDCNNVSMLSNHIMVETFNHGLLRLYLHQHRIHDSKVKSSLILDHECIDIATGRIKEQHILNKLVGALSVGQILKDVTIEDIQNEKERMAIGLRGKEEISDWEVVNGHDAVKMTLLLLNHGLCRGRIYRDMFKEHHINQMILRNVNFQDLLKTELREDLIKWQDGHGVDIVVSKSKTFRRRLGKRISERWG